MGYRSTIMVRLKGGLGNQFFQYAMGRAMSIRRNMPLKLDLDFYRTQSLRQYELHRFNIVERFPSALEEFTLYPPQWRGAWRLSRLTKRLLPGLRFIRVDEPSDGSHALVLEQQGSLYLDGYWQSEKYFNDVADQLRGELSLKSEPDARNQETMQAIRACNAVCIHVRRGDYVSNSATNAHHGTCSPDYYHKALRFVGEHVAKPSVFVFSDDPEWVKAHIQIDYPTTFVTHNLGNQDHEDLRLMVCCRHFIIANSSFSWWGAWLSAHPEKVVIAPQAWFVTQDRQSDDLIPHTWLRL